MRLKQLDVLRGVAILLVLGRHMDACPGWVWPPVRIFFDAWKQAGWVGVDLFFVLSGFLISGLLFCEYKRYRTITVKRFLIRRALKIYPAFYFLLAVTLSVSALVGEPLQLKRLVAEALYVQNYAGGLWWHTWSLAVEEHFYVLLPLCLLTMAKRGGGAVNPFRGVVPLVLGLAVFLCALRVITAYSASLGSVHVMYPTLFPTHLRVDSLAWGVMLSYFYHFRMFSLERLVLGRRIFLTAASLVLILPCLFLKIESSMLMKTVGLSGLYLGFGGVVMVSLFVGQPLHSAHARSCAWLSTALAFVGVYSYSIYLWHVPLAHWGLALLRRALPNGTTFVVQFLVYACGSLVVGVALSKLIEIPALRLRDRVFPSRIPPMRTPATLDAVTHVPLAGAALGGHIAC